MKNPVLQAIHQRRSIRAYTGEQLTREEVALLMEAALSSPSARNRQPWHFTVVQRGELIQRIEQATLAQLKLEADPEQLERMSRPGYTIFHGAPTVIFLSADVTHRYAALDSGIAVQNIALAAHSLGLGSVILGMPRGAFEGPQKEAFEKELEFPRGWAFQIAIGVGRPAAGKEKPAPGEGKITILS